MTPNHDIDLESLLLHPVAFGQELLRNKYYPWQETVLDSIYRNTKTALKTANGSGKTDKIISTAVLWWLSAFKGSRCIITSASWDQVLQQIWPALTKHSDKFGKGWIITKDQITAPNGSDCLGRSTNEPGKFEGHHRLPPFTEKNGPLMIIADESKSISDDIFGAINRCTFQRLLIASSTGAEQGYFYRAFTSNASNFQTFTATAYDCPHKSKESIDEIIAEHGIDDPWVRSVVFAEFMKDSGAGDWYKPVKLTDYERCLLDPPRKKMGERFAFCDFAAGGDENVIAAMEGNEILPLTCWRDKDTVRAAHDFIQKLRELGIPADNCFGDEDGTGHGVMDNMDRAGFKIGRVRNGTKARSDKYFNAGSEAWYECGNTIRRKEIILPHDQVLREQLTGRKGDRKGGEGKYYVQPKKELTKSPDRGDAVAGVIYWKGCGQVHQTPTSKSFLFQDEENEEKGDFNREELISQGLWTG